MSAECRERYRDVYPADSNGDTILPYSRVFMIAST